MNTRAVVLTLLDRSVVLNVLSMVRVRREIAELSTLLLFWLSLLGDKAVAYRHVRIVTLLGLRWVGSSEAWFRCWDV